MWPNDVGRATVLGEIPIAESVFARTRMLVEKVECVCYNFSTGLPVYMRDVQSIFFITSTFLFRHYGHLPSCTSLTVTVTDTAWSSDCVAETSDTAEPPGPWQDSIRHRFPSLGWLFMTHCLKLLSWVEILAHMKRHFVHPEWSPTTRRLSVSLTVSDCHCMSEWRNRISGFDR